MKINLLKEMVSSYHQLKSTAKLLILIAFIESLSTGVWSFCIPLYLLSEGYSFTSIGWIGGIGGFTNVLMLFFTPSIVNRTGKRNALTAGFALVFAGMGLYLFWVNLAIYILGQVLLNIGTALIGPTYSALLSDTAPKEEGKYAFSLISFSNSAGYSIGVLLAGNLPAWIKVFFNADLHTLFIHLIIASLILWIFQIFFFLKLKIKDTGNLSVFSLKSRNKPLLLKFVITNGLIGAGAGLVVPWITLFFTKRYFLDAYGGDFDAAYDMALPRVSFVMMIGSVMMAVSFLIAPFLAEKWGSIRVIIFFQAAGSLAIIGMPFCPDFYSSSALWIIRTVLMNVSTPLVSAFMMENVPEDEKTSFNSITAFAWNLPWSISYFLAGPLWKSSYFYLTFLICAAFYAFSTILFFFFFQTGERKVLSSKEA